MYQKHLKNRQYFSLISFNFKTILPIIMTLQNSWEAGHTCLTLVLISVPFAIFLSINLIQVHFDRFLLVKPP